MNAEYIHALQMRADWLAWANSEQPLASGWHDNVENRSAFPLYLQNLTQGDTFYMNRTFCELVDHARLTVPDDMVFDPTWMQSRNGFMWLQTPFKTPPIIESEVSMEEWANGESGLSAVGWLYIPIGTATMQGPTTVESYEILTYVDFARVNPRVPGFGCWSYFRLEPGDKVIDRIVKFEGAIEQQQSGGYVKGRVSDQLHEIRWFFTAFNLMAQRLAVTLHHNTDRATRRRAERERKVVQPHLKVIALRKQEEARARAIAANGQRQPVDWQWHWAVRGHWRNQFCKSTGGHRPVFIESYIKGDFTKPMKPPDAKLFTAVR